MLRSALTPERTGNDDVAAAIANKYAVPIRNAITYSLNSTIPALGAVQTVKNTVDDVNNITKGAVDRGAARRIATGEPSSAMQVVGDLINSSENYTNGLGTDLFTGGLTQMWPALGAVQSIYNYKSDIDDITSDAIHRRASRISSENSSNTERSADSKSEEGLKDGQGDTEPVEQKDVEEKKSPDYDIDEMAGEFILGAWGNGQDRIDNMIGAGYSLDDYNKIQQRVNEAYESGRDLHEWTNKANAKLHYW